MRLRVEEVMMWVIDGGRFMRSKAAAMREFRPAAKTSLQIRKSVTGELVW